MSERNLTQNASIERIEGHFTALSRIGNLGESMDMGFTRPAWSDEETAAIDYIIGEAEKSGFKAEFDSLGNAFISYNSDACEQCVQVGSHLDTVVRGGLFDGAAGIVAGLEALSSLANSGRPLQKRLQLVIWRGEESGSYGAALKGSKAAFGLLPSSALQARFQGQTLEEAITKQGYSAENIRLRKPSINQLQIDSIAAHIELHIEQGAKLELDGDDIGIVTSIRGPRRMRVMLRGEAAHSGSTPMGSAYRKDANLAMAQIHVQLDLLAQEKLAEGADLVQTIGVINSDRDFNREHPEIYECGITKVCPFAYFTLDIRSSTKTFLDSYSQSAKYIIEDISRAVGVEAEIAELGSSEPLELLDPALQELAEEAAKNLGYPAQRLASGAGHDVQIVAQQKKSSGEAVPSLLLFIPCRLGISHSPREWTSSEAVKKGADVIEAVLAQLVF